MTLDSEFAALVLVGEDKRFWRHSGVDVLALARATFKAAIGQPRGGASTIEMQLVRTLAGRRERTFARKVWEIRAAARMESAATKETLLAWYLDVAYFGEDVIGAQAAAAKLFHNKVEQCTVLQKAILASLLVYPIPRSRSLAWYKRVFRRARWIVRRYKSLPGEQVRDDFQRHGN
jgi:membrane peptidoglycan carboxypeptidase